VPPSYAVGFTAVLIIPDGTSGMFTSTQGSVKINKVDPAEFVSSKLEEHDENSLDEFTMPLSPVTPSTSPNTFSKPENLFSKPENTFSKPENLFSKPENTFSKPENLFSKPENLFSKPENL
jgi:hypothetical protein